MISHVSWEKRLERDNRRVIILDDDPTGTQTVANVEVILQPSLQAYRRFFSGSKRATYILTNTRAFHEERAVQFLRNIKAEVQLVADEFGAEVCFLLRGDSTLRGHVFAEIDVFSTNESISLFVPAFPEGGRVTVGGIHYLDNGSERKPVAKTEFAQDTVFGFQSVKMVDWVSEVGGDRSVRTISLEEIKEFGSKKVMTTLLQAPAGAVIIPDAETREDLLVIAAGLLDAEQAGRKIVVRSASSFAAIRSGLHGSIIRSFNDGPRERVLLVCGSHTIASSVQLEKVTSQHFQPVIIPMQRLIEEEDTAGMVAELAIKLAQMLETHKFAILATERNRKSEHGDLSIGAKVMDALTAIVRLLADRVDVVISKGGITSAQVATDGLHAHSASVLGQIQPGVSLWDLQLPNNRSIPYAIIPGNVGNERTIQDVATLFGVEPFGLSHLRMRPIKQNHLVTEVTSKLMDYLLSGEIKPGEKLPGERQLSEAVGVGRSTLREALKALTVLGLLEVKQGSGTFLKKTESSLLPQVIEWGLLLGERHSLDLVETRAKVEVIIAELAAKRRDALDVEELRMFLKGMESAGSDYQAYVEADIKFHFKLAEAARNMVLRDILSSVRTLLRTWIISVLQSAEDTAFSYEEHLKIFDAIELGDPQQAAKAMEAHMKSASERLKQAIAGVDSSSIH